MGFYLFANSTVFFSKIVWIRVKLNFVLSNHLPFSLAKKKLGPNGTSLIDIQSKSGVTIQISKKGMFAPGTKNRIVTITGAPNAIQLAQFLIEQKVHEEETKRRNQNTITGIPGIMQ